MDAFGDTEFLQPGGGAIGQPADLGPGPMLAQEIDRRTVAELAHCVIQRLKGRYWGIFK